MNISVIITVGSEPNNLTHILPLLTTMENAEIIIVPLEKYDYLSEAFLAQYGVKIILPNTSIPLSHSQARNIGAKIAVSNVLFFLNLDYLPIADIAQWVRNTMQAKTYYVEDDNHSDVQGLLMCIKADFIAIDGYDEVLSGTPIVGIDLIERLDELGHNRKIFPPNLYAPIAQWKLWREETKATNKTPLANFYRIIKRDLTLLKGIKPTYDFRRALMDDLTNLHKLAELRGLNEFAVSIKTGPFNIDNSSSAYSRDINYVFEMVR